MHKDNKTKEINKRNSKLPRLIVRISNTSSYAQIVDDQSGKILASASSLKIKKNAEETDKYIGSQIAEMAKKKKIKRVVFDKGRKKYHGHIKNIADSARAAGLKI